MRAFTGPHGAGFVACGLTPARAADGYRAVWQFTVGELIIRRGLDRVAASGRRPFVIDELTGVDPAELPTLAALEEHWAPARERDSCDIGIAALIDGLLAADGQRASGGPDDAAGP